MSDIMFLYSALSSLFRPNSSQTHRDEATQQTSMVRQDSAPSQNASCRAETSDSFASPKPDRARALQDLRRQTEALPVRSGQPLARAAQQRGTGLQLSLPFIISHASSTAPWAQNWWACVGELGDEHKPLIDHLVGSTSEGGQKDNAVISFSGQGWGGRLSPDAVEQGNKILESKFDPDILENILRGPKGKHAYPALQVLAVQILRARSILSEADQAQTSERLLAQLKTIIDVLACHPEVVKFDKTNAASLPFWLSGHFHDDAALNLFLRHQLRASMFDQLSHVLAYFSHSDISSSSAHTFLDRFLRLSCAHLRSNSNTVDLEVARFLSMLCKLAIEKKSLPFLHTILQNIKAYREKTVVMTTCLHLCFDDGFRGGATAVLASDLSLVYKVHDVPNGYKRSWACSSQLHLIGGDRSASPSHLEAQVDLLIEAGIDPRNRGTKDVLYLPKELLVFPMPALFYACLEHNKPLALLLGKKMGEANVEAAFDDIAHLANLFELLNEFDRLAASAFTSQAEVLIALKDVVDFTTCAFRRGGFAQSFPGAKGLRRALAQIDIAVENVEDRVATKTFTFVLIRDVMHFFSDWKRETMAYALALSATPEYAAEAARGRVPMQFLSLLKHATKESHQGKQSTLSSNPQFTLQPELRSTDGSASSQRALRAAKSIDINRVLNDAADLENNFDISPLGLLALVGNAEAVELYLKATDSVAVDHAAEALTYCSSTDDRFGQKKSLASALRIARAVIGRVCCADDVYLMAQTAISLNRSDFLGIILKQATLREVDLWNTHAADLPALLRLGAEESWEALEALGKSVPREGQLADALLNPGQDDDAALHIVARQGWKCRMQLDWLTQSPKLVAGWCAQKNSEGKTPLEEALAHGDASLLQNLYKLGVRLNFVEGPDARALCELILDGLSVGRGKLVKTLLEMRGGQTFLKTHTQTLLQMAFVREDLDAAKVLLREFAPSLQAPSEGGRNVFHMAADYDAVELVEFLYHVPKIERLKFMAARDSENQLPKNRCTSAVMLRLCMDSAQNKTTRAGTKQGDGENAPEGAEVIEIPRTPAEIARASIRKSRWPSKLGSCATGAKRGAVIDAFLAQAQALADPSTALRQALNDEAWTLMHRLHTLSPKSEAMGHHFAAHQPKISNVRLLKRLNDGIRQGSSRFGEGDGLAVLAARQEAMSVAFERMKDNHTAYTLYLYDATMRGYGYRAAPLGQKPRIFDNSPYLKFVLRPSEHEGVAIVAMYPVPQQEGAEGVLRGLRRVAVGPVPDKEGALV